MSPSIKILVLTSVLCCTGAVSAQDPPTVRDARAVAVLEAMSSYLAGLERFSVSGEGSTDARLDAGLIVANPIEVVMRAHRPNSLHIRRFDGAETQHLYVNDGTITLYNTARGFYASADVPEGIEAAMGFALEELGIEAPLMDLLHHDVFEHLAGSSDPVLYLTENSLVAGTDCHHVAIRNADVDIQLWIEEGERPLPRQLILTSKWEGGSPRFVARLDWDLEPDFGKEAFRFEPPDGVSQIEFLPAAAE